MNPEETQSFAKFLLNQGVGIFFGSACLAILYFYWRLHDKQRDEVERRLSDLLRERKADRDMTLLLMGRIEAYLTHSEAFEYSRKVISEVTNKNIPKRRAIDKILTEAMRQERAEDENED